VGPVPPINNGGAEFHPAIYVEFYDIRFAADIEGPGQVFLIEYTEAVV
jgi:hypothetical protein